MAQTISVIRELLNGHGLRPKYRHGQNFLHDGNQMNRIVNSAAAQSGEVVLEVGAGTGALTERLLDAGARVVTVEIDRDLEPILQERLGHYGDHLVLIIDDVLTGKHTINPKVIEAIRAIASARGLSPENNPGATQPVGFKLVANLPYNVASPLLVNLAQETADVRMDLAVALLQREVAERLTANPGTKDYGPIGIMIQSLYHVETIGHVSPTCFWPQPQVESSIIRARRRDTPLCDPAKLSETLRLIFQRRRKQLGSILGRGLPLPPGIDPTARAEDLSIEQIARLAMWRSTG
jgi:16S rRNA (adenine1518-N6/adenine1519-N6)-dimethyltransferase